MRLVEEIPAGSGSTKLYLYVENIVTAMEVSHFWRHMKIPFVNNRRLSRRMVARKRAKFSLRVTRDCFNTLRTARATTLPSTLTNKCLGSYFIDNHKLDTTRLQ